MAPQIMQDSPLFKKDGQPSRVRKGVAVLLGIAIVIASPIAIIGAMLNEREDARIQNNALAVTALQEASADTYGVELTEEDVTALLSLQDENEYAHISAARLNFGKEAGTLWKSEPVNVTVDGQDRTIQLAWLENKWALVNVLDNPYPEELEHTTN